MTNFLLFTDSVFYGSTTLLLVVAGVLISIRLLNFPDLTVDGSFTLGACIFSKVIVLGGGPVLAMFGAALAGLFAGMATATLNERFKIGQILSSVLVMLAIIAAAPYILGQATVGLLQEKTLISYLEYYDAGISRLLFPNEPFIIHPVAIICLLVFGLLILAWIRLFVHSGPGTMIRYYGSANSPRTLLGTSLPRVKLLALGLGNMIIAVGGAIEAQRRGGADQNMGIGMILIALASLILGETLLRIILKRERLSPGLEVFAVIIGTVLYSIIIQTVLLFGPSIIDIRLVSVIFLMMFLAAASRKFPRNLDMF